MQNGGSVSQVRLFFRSKWVKIILGIDAIIIIAIVVVLIINSTKTATINFNIAPTDAKIQLNGQGEYSDGIYHIHPGTYEVTISHDNLITKSFHVDLKAGYVTTLTTFLAGSDKNFSFYTLKNNYGSFEKLTSIASQGNNQTTDHDDSAEEFISDFEHTMSIMNALPVKGYVHADPNVNASTAGFTIRNGINKEECKKTACLLVNYYGKGYEEEVKKAIRDAGYAPEDYQIIYERYN